MPHRTALIALRLTLGLLTLAAVGRQFALHVQYGFSAVNFFSYFTNLANLFAAVVLLVGAVRVVQRRAASATDDRIRGAATTYMAVVGLVFAALLRNVDLGALLPWVNTVLHTVMPIAVVLEWLYAPPRSTLGARQVLLYQAVPLLYLVYVLGRGAAVGWYPYPFLNPAVVGGYGGVAAYVVGIVVVFLVVGWAVTAVGNARRPRSSA